MSHIETAITYSKKIEGVLVESYGATGKGLHEKLSSVESSLQADISRKIRYIASVRNKLVHQDGYVLDDPSSFERSCEQVLQAIKTDPVRPTASNTSKSSTEQLAGTSGFGLIDILGYLFGIVYVILLIGKKCVWWIYGFLLLTRALYGYNDTITTQFYFVHVFIVISLNTFGLFSLLMYRLGAVERSTTLRFAMHMLAYALLSTFVGDATLAKFIWSIMLMLVASMAWVLVLVFDDKKATIKGIQSKTTFTNILWTKSINNNYLKTLWVILVVGAPLYILFKYPGVIISIMILVLVLYLWIKWGESGNESSSVLQAQSAPVPANNTQIKEDEYGLDSYPTPVKTSKPKLNFSGIFGMQDIKTKLLEPAQLIVAPRNAQTGAEPPANGIVFFGDPGNGKTVFAEALAGELQVPLVSLTYGDISSMWLGQMPRLIANCFAYAKQQAPCVLFLDEIDSFIKSRDTPGSSAEDLKITNTILTEIVKLRDHRVVLIGATNYLANLDAAAIREGRFDYKIEITAPDEEARIGILQKGVAKHAQHLNVDADAVISVAKRWNGFSVSRLLAVVKALPRYAKDNNLTDIGYDEWMRALREVQGRNGRVPENTKSLNELILDAQTREALNMVGSRLKDVERIESLGGTLPSGVLFHGPSGTGKTAAACALAKEVDWAFLSVAGPDLLADREKITTLYAEAKDIRPCIIFIDEADDVLRNRQYSSTPDLTNRLLVLMDGSAEKVKDVVFIAATNHPDQIDPALLRTGRFTEKVEFMPPPQDQIPKFVSTWLKGKKVMLDAGLDAWEISALLEGQTIANIEGVLQYALNRAISQHTTDQKLIVKMEDFQAGLRVVLVEGSQT